MAKASSFLTRRSVAKAALLTLPILLWSALMFSRAFQSQKPAPRLAAAIIGVFMVVLFFLMMRTGETNRWRRWFFVALGFLFPVGFIWELVALRGSMSIPVEQMISGNTPFCFIPITMVLVPAALSRVIIFPGSILPTATNQASVATMFGLWLAASLVLGRAWCAYACFFGGIEEGFAAAPRKPRWRNLDLRWRWMPWAVLVAIVLLSAAIFEPVYCMWLCPFKAVTEYPEVRSVETAVQAAIFLSLFAGLVVVLPLITKKRTQCSFFCPFGAFQALFNKIHVFDVRIQREHCGDCVLCERECPVLAIDKQVVDTGQTRMHCIKCGACVDACPKGAAVWHIKGTEPGVKPERARLMFLYAAWMIATMFGGSILAGSLEKLLGLWV